ncbi:MAG: Mur ligase family protein [Solirubrobacterales bacterium]
MSRSRTSLAPASGITDLVGAASPRPPLPPGPFLVVGLGRAGISAARALATHCAPDEVRVWDSSADDVQRRRAAELRALGVEVCLGGDGLDLLAGCATVIKSPGVPPEVPLVQAAFGRGLQVLDELEIGWRLVPAPIVGVTGTKGKSTVSALCVAILAAHGLEPVLCGNTEFGPPITELALAPPPPALVAESSSYQLEFPGQMLVDGAVFTNLSVDHLHRHASMAAYGEAKRNLFVRGDEAVPLAALNVDDEFGARLAGEVEERGGRVLRYGRDRRADYRIVDCRWGLRHAELELETPGGPVELATRLPGLHNAANVTAALALADGLGLDRGPTLAALATAPPVPGRFEAVEVDAPFDVVVDLGATPAGVEAALRAAGPLARARGGRLLAVLTALDRSAVTHGTRTGALARELADHLILSASSYRGEARLPRVAALAAGARGAAGGELEIIIDRRRAIARALGLARRGDVVALIGRGPIAREATDLRGGYIELEDGRVAVELVRESGAVRR